MFGWHFDRWYTVRSFDEDARVLWFLFQSVKNIRVTPKLHYLPTIIRCVTHVTVSAIQYIKSTEISTADGCGLMKVVTLNLDVWKFTGGKINQSHTIILQASKRIAESIVLKSSVVWMYEVHSAAAMGWEDAVYSASMSEVGKPKFGEIVVCENNLYRLCSEPQLTWIEVNIIVPSWSRSCPCCR